MRPLTPFEMAEDAIRRWKEAEAKRQGTQIHLHPESHKGLRGMIVDALQRYFKQREEDGCVFCLGRKGGAAGNENLFGGHKVCDFCTSFLLKIMKAHPDLVEKVEFTSDVQTGTFEVNVTTVRTIDGARAYNLFPAYSGKDWERAQATKNEWLDRMARESGKQGAKVSQVGSVLEALESFLDQLRGILGR